MKTTTETKKPQRLEADSPEARILITSGRNLISQFAAMQKLVRIYNRTNETVLQAAASLQTTIERMLEAGSPLELRFWKDCIYMNNLRMRYDISNFSTYKNLLQTAITYGIEAIVFEQGVTVEEIVEFFVTLKETDPEGESPLTPDTLTSRGITHITVHQGFVQGQPRSFKNLPLRSTRERAKRAFYFALKSAKAAFLAETRGGMLNVRKARRAVQAAIDILLEDESSLIAMATIKDHDEYTFTHSVNVCIFSLAIGQRIGLTKNQLAKLGIAALFHDIGKVDIPKEVLNKVGMLNVDEWKRIRDHTLTGVQMLSRVPKCSEQILRSMVVAFQHHINIDFSGYPSLKDKIYLDLFSRIVRIADTYDAMTTERPYMNKVYSPYEAVRYLLSEAGRKFDPILVKALVNALGIYPPGTFVRLNTGETGIVVCTSDESQFDTPVVKIVGAPDGSRVAPPRLIRLGDPVPPDGKSHYRITAILSSAGTKRQVRHYLMP